MVLPGPASRPRWLHAFADSVWAGRETGLP